jgi:head-tail adaptor
MPFREPLSMEGHRQIKVNVEKLVAAQDSYGAPSTSWTLFAAGVTVALEETTGQEKYADQQIESLSRFEVLMHYMRGMNEKMRLNFTNDGTLFLLNVINAENYKMQNRWLILRCKSGVDRG